MKPRVLLSTNYGSRRFTNYIEAVERAGGECAAVSESDALEVVLEKAEDADAWLICGGRDLPEGNEPLHPSVNLISKERLAIESVLFDYFFASDKPVLGICMGAQFIAWRLGGKLVQDLPEEGVDGHGSASGEDEETVVQLEPNSKLATIMDVETTPVRCHHHQGIRSAPEGFCVSAWEAKRPHVIEAIEHSASKWIIGVQWHPERTRTQECSKLFDAFVRTAATRHSERALQE